MSPYVSEYVSEGASMVQGNTQAQGNEGADFLGQTDTGNDEVAGERANEEASVQMADEDCHDKGDGAAEDCQLNGAEAGAVDGAEAEAGAMDGAEAEAMDGAEAEAMDVAMDLAEAEAGAAEDWQVNGVEAGASEQHGPQEEEVPIQGPHEEAQDLGADDGPHMDEVEGLHDKGPTQQTQDVDFDNFFQTQHQPPFEGLFEDQNRELPQRQSEDQPPMPTEEELHHSHEWVEVEDWDDDLDEYIVDPDYDILDGDEDLTTELRSNGQLPEENEENEENEQDEENEENIGASQNRAGGRPKGKAQFESGGVDRTIHQDTVGGDSEYVESDGNRSISDSEEEGGEDFNVFDEDHDHEGPTFSIGMLFTDREQFKKACREWGIHHRYQLHFPVNEITRVRAKCYSKSKCKFYVFASKLHLKDPNDNTFRVKTLDLRHTCPKVSKNFHLTSAVLADKYLEEFRNDPEYKSEVFVKKIQTDLKQSISIQRARRARRAALDKLEGDEDRQYEKLYDYKREVLRTNPGSTVEFKEARGKFQGMYVCFDGLKQAFVNGMRQIVCLDGCWLKGKYGGQLLSATGIDPNDCMYPLAYAWLKTENTETWMWFIGLLSVDLHLTNAAVFMSDKQKGLLNAVKELFPYSEHRFCWRHLWANFRSTFHTQHMKPFIWNIGTATYKAAMDRAMKALEDKHDAGYKWIKERDRKHWCRALFKEEVKCDILLNNLAEAFNKYILAAREKPVLTMFEMIRTQLMKRINDKQKFGGNMEGELCPKIRKKLAKIIDYGWKFTADPGGSPQWQVEGPGGQFVVDLANRTCTCRRWQLSGIPCSHATPCIYGNNQRPEEFVDDCYSVATYQRVYSYVINPMNGPDMWETDPEPANIILPPSPVHKKKRGRIPTARKKEAEELEKQRVEKAKEAAAGREKLPRKGNMRMTCSLCGQYGHNKRGCLKRSGGQSTHEVGGPSAERVPGGQSAEREPGGQSAEREPVLHDSPVTLRWMMDGTSQVVHRSPSRRDTFPFVDQAVPVEPPLADQGQPDQNHPGDAEENAFNSQRSSVDDGAPSQPIPTQAEKGKGKRRAKDVPSRYMNILRKRSKKNVVLEHGLVVVILLIIIVVHIGSILNHAFDCFEPQCCGCFRNGML
ncbi:uncharacterized protein LOC126682005 [Mercurialis annua]|uniref:uncharacterized protein LOC126682005 n=1 Tax=Mercurialis annua TaxID=3986 RepID=UPI00215E5A24|nr:uncharacterized protein LOC126682005 [Mercurialis annua]